MAEKQMVMRMSDHVVAYASVLRLDRKDIKVLRIRDAYGIHRVIYGLFEDTRTSDEKNGSDSSGIVFVDKGEDRGVRQILIVSDRKPHQTPQFGVVDTRIISEKFLSFDRYGFEVTLNPTKRSKENGKTVPIKTTDGIMDWVKSRASVSWGFSVVPDSLQILRVGVQSFEKEGHVVTHGFATIKGLLDVTDRSRFIMSFTHGIGRGRAFGFGLLQVVPLFI